VTSAALAAFVPPPVPADHLGTGAEAVLPVQLLPGRRAGADLVPEKRLMLAVLEEAVATFQRTATARGGRAARDHEAAWAWMASRDLAWPFSFVNVCHALDLDPDALRSGLRRWRGAARTAGDGAPRYRTPFRRVNGSRTRATEHRRSSGARAR
jgi:hypothetical protein